MSDHIELGKVSDAPIDIQHSTADSINKRPVPQYADLQNQLEEASLLIKDIVLKKYLTHLSNYDIIPLDDSLKDITDIRLFKITEMVYQKDEYSTYKFASVFNSVQGLNCGIFIVADSNGCKTDFYLGVRSLDSKRTTKSLRDTLRNALCGQFPGVKTKDLLDTDAENFLASLPSKNISSVSCISNNKDSEIKDNESFLQGLDKFALAMQGQKYTAIILAKSTSQEQLEDTRKAYEEIYTQLSPFSSMQVNYGNNQALSISHSLTHGTSTSNTHTYSQSVQTGTSTSHQESSSESEAKRDSKAILAKAGGSALLGVASILTAPLTGGASLVAAGTILAGQVGLNLIDPKTTTKSSSTSTTRSENSSSTNSSSDSNSSGRNESKSATNSTTTGSSESLQLTQTNKMLKNMLDRIDNQLKRLDECESIGMWECAAYFLSDRQETAEMAAGTYKALMSGEKSGIESSAINYWGRSNSKNLCELREYITNFIHPVFAYRSKHSAIPVTAASLISSNELAIQLGLPRKSVCGFPVIEHSDFGKEVVTYDKTTLPTNSILLGNIVSMGQTTPSKVFLDRESFTMHTFVTGSTGAGKSNTVYKLLNELCFKPDSTANFLVIEPAKGEYKDVLGGLPGVSVYGTNLKKTPLLKLNPFSFPEDTHVLEHIDRLTEVFNACWPMYAAMPAVLKAAIEQAYVNCGWSLISSTCYGRVFPTFIDVMKTLPAVVDSKGFSGDTQGDYKGALLTRIESLTNGINGQVLCSVDELSDDVLFDNKVIIDLSRVGSSETKALLMGILVLKLQEYRMAQRAEGKAEVNGALRHITVLEEAHNLLRRSSYEQTQESSNLQGKSVEMLTNAIAEMRTYGEGFIIADQAPGLLDMAVIRNTNTKIIMRLPGESDRELVGKAAGLNSDQISELAKLDVGVAAVFQNHWLEPMLCKVERFEGGQAFQYTPTVHTEAPATDLLFNYILHGKVDNSELKIEDVDSLRKWIDRLDTGSYAKTLLNKALENGSLSEEEQNEMLYCITKGKSLIEREEDSVFPESAKKATVHIIMDKLKVSENLAIEVRSHILQYVSSMIKSDPTHYDEIKRLEGVK